MKIESFTAFENAIKSQNLLKKYNLEKIGVFGSFARDEKAADIDIYIDSEIYDMKKLIGFKNDLEKMSNKYIDIMLKKYANPIVLYRAKKDMRYVIG